MREVAFQSGIGGYFPLTESRYTTSLNSLGPSRIVISACLASSFVSNGPAPTARPIMETTGRPVPEMASIVRFCSSSSRHAVEATQLALRRGGFCGETSALQCLHLIAAFLIVSAQYRQSRSPVFVGAAFSADHFVFADEAQTRAPTHPKKVYPNSRFTKKIDVPFTCFRPEATKVGKK